MVPQPVPADSVAFERLADFTAFCITKPLLLEGQKIDLYPSSREMTKVSDDLSSH
jgi:hypothetical protein